jgi:hypothetical protein
MRSYGTDTADPFEAQIWEVARATTAAATFFPEITIDDVRYGDGGTGWNNPAAEAVAEAHAIWPRRPIGCLVSLGTGLEDAIQLGGSSTEISQGLMQSILRGVAPGTSYQVQVAKYCVASLTSCEKVHRDLSEKYPDKVVPGGNYFRLNVPQGMYRIGLDEHKKLGEIISLTEDYLQDGELVMKMTKVARLLWQPELAS